jgi:hypothetical protein
MSSRYQQVVAVNDAIGVHIVAERHIGYGLTCYLDCSYVISVDEGRLVGETRPIGSRGYERTSVHTHAACVRVSLEGVRSPSTVEHGFRTFAGRTQRADLIYDLNVAVTFTW